MYQGLPKVQPKNPAENKRRRTCQNLKVRLACDSRLAAGLSSFSAEFRLKWILSYIPIDVRKNPNSSVTALRHTHFFLFLIMFIARSIGRRQTSPCVCLSVGKTNLFYCGERHTRQILSALSLSLSAPQRRYFDEIQ